MIEKPKTREEMMDYIKRIGVYEGFDLLGDIVGNGWAQDKGEAKAWLESLSIFPWDD